AWRESAVCLSVLVLVPHRLEVGPVGSHEHLGASGSLATTRRIKEGVDRAAVEGEGLACRLSHRLPTELGLGPDPAVDLIDHRGIEVESFRATLPDILERVGPRDDGLRREGLAVGRLALSHLGRNNPGEVVLQRDQIDDGQSGPVANYAGAATI